MAYALIIIAWLVLFVTGIWLVVIGFQRSILWGLAVLFIPFAGLIFVIMYWQDAKKPFLISLGAFAVFVAGIFMLPQGVDTGNLAQVMMGIQSGEIKPNEAFDEYAKADNEQQGSPSMDAMKATGSEETPAQPMATDETGKKPTSPSASNDKGEMVTVDEVVDGKVETNEVEELVAKPAKQEDANQFPSPGNVKPDPLAVKKLKEDSATIRVKLENVGAYTGRYFVVTTKDGNEHRGLLKKVNASNLYLTRKLYGGNFDYVLAKSKIARVDMLKEEYVKEFMDR